MVRPADTKDDKNPNKKSLEMSPSMLMMISNAIMLLVILVAFFVMYMLFNQTIDKKLSVLVAQNEQGEIEEGDEDVKEEGILLELEDTILNLADVSGKKYLKVGVAMEISKTQEEIEMLHAAASAKPSGGHGHGAAPVIDPNAEIVAAIERYKPAIKDSIISVLSSKTSDELFSVTGKEIAKEEIVESVNSIFGGKREVIRVSFGQFVIQ